MSVSTSTPPATLVDDAPYQSIEGLVIEERDPRTFEANVKSPYVDTEIISLDVGPRQTRYRVHRAILAQSSELDAKPSLKLWGEKTHDTISLPELDEMTAHTLVHFLYTGRYNTLEPRDIEARSALSQYKFSTCAYCAAIRYKLPGLAELAKQTMLVQQEHLTIFDVLVVAREHAFPLLPEDESWFSTYLEDTIHVAVTKDAELFTRPGFVDQIQGDRRYRQVVMKAIVNSYSQAPPAVDTPPVVQEKEQRASTLSPVVAIANHDADMSTGETLLDEITPTLEAHVAPEPYSDELGWESSKTFQNQKMGAQSIVTAPVPTKPVHVRADSAVLVEDNAPISVTAEKMELAKDQETPIENIQPAITRDVDEKTELPVNEIPSPTTNGVDGSGTASKKSKKNSKKKKSAGTVFAK